MSENTADQNLDAQGRTFVWHEVYAPSSQDTIDFYTKALDFGSTTMPMGEMGDYKLLTRNGVPVAGVMGTDEMPGIEAPPHWATYIAVDDVDSRLATCIRLGATQVVAPMDVPGVGRMALIADPQGAHVWIFTPSDANCGDE